MFRLGRPQNRYYLLPLIVGWLLLGAGCALGPTAGPSASTGSTTAVPATEEAVVTHRVNGMVLNSLTNTPVPEALVSVRGQVIKTRADVSGRFSFDLPPGEHFIFADKEHFQRSYESAIRVIDDDLQIQLLMTPADVPEHELQQPSLKYESGETGLRVTAVDPFDAEPVAGLQVSFQGIDLPGEQVTDAQGRWQTNELTPGTYLMRLSSPPDSAVTYGSGYLYLIHVVEGHTTLVDVTAL